MSFNAIRENKILAKISKFRVPYSCLGQIRVFQVKGLKILGMVVTHIFFFYYFFSGKKYNFMDFERHFAYQNA